MTPKELKKSSIKELIIAFSNKARCSHTESMADSIYKELKSRVGDEVLYGIRLEYFHIKNGEKWDMFDFECKNLLKLLT